MAINVEIQNNAIRAFIRFRDLPQPELELLRRAVPNHALSLHSTGGASVAVLEIDGELDIAVASKPIARNFLAEPRCRIWVSVVSQFDNGGLAVPPNMREFIYQTGCGVDLAFVTYDPECALTEILSAERSMLVFPN